MTAFERLQAERNAGGTQLCRVCGEMLPLTQFRMEKRGGWRRTCDLCVAPDRQRARRWEEEEEGMRRSFEKRHKRRVWGEIGEGR